MAISACVPLELVLLVHERHCKLYAGYKKQCHVHCHIFPDGPVALFKMNTYAFVDTLQHFRRPPSAFRCQRREERWQMLQTLLPELQRIRRYRI